MLDFEKFLARHGEVVTQAVLENLERHEGIRAGAHSSLEDRWSKVMHPHFEQRLAA